MTGPLNGKTGDLVRWILGLCLAALVAYFTAIGSIREQQATTNGRVSVIESQVKSNFDEVQRTLNRMEDSQEQRFNELKNYFQFIIRNGADARTGEPYRVQEQQR